MFQSPENQLFAETVLDDVAFGPRNQGLSDDEAVAVARSALGDVGLDDATFGARSPFALSGGEARRVAIAGVLAMRPGYVLMDEPTAGLDASGREAVASVVDGLKAEAGVVVVSHDIEQFLPVADRVLLLSQGRSAYFGAASELISEPERFYDAGLRPPAVLEAQVLAAERGGALSAPYTLDPAAAAESLLASADGVR